VQPCQKIGSVAQLCVCLRDPKLDPSRIPIPFAANDHIIKAGDATGLIAALALKGAKPRI